MMEIPLMIQLIAIKTAGPRLHGIDKLWRELTSLSTNMSARKIKTELGATKNAGKSFHLQFLMEKRRLRAMSRKTIETRIAKKMVLEDLNFSRKEREKCRISMRLLCQDLISTQNSKSTNLLSGASTKTTCS